VSNEFETDENGVAIITRAQLRNKAQKRRSGPGRRQRWYDRATVVRVADHRPRNLTIQHVIKDGDLARNNGAIVIDREGQTAMVIAVDHNNQTADVIGPEGPTTWQFREIDRTVATQRDDS